MTRLVFVTQLVDRDDPVLGVTVDLIRALAKRCEDLAVISNEVRSVPRDLDVEIVSLGKERGAGKFGRGVRYEEALIRLGRRLRPHALLAHMCPIYVNLAAPVARAMRIRTMLWFIYPQVTPTLLAAERFSDLIITALPDSYPRRLSKVRPIGHAIDVRTFAFTPPRSRGGPFRLLSMGRTAPVKRHDVTLRAIASLRNQVDLTLRIVGASTTPAEHRHREELARTIERLDLESIATLEDPVPRSHIPRLLRDADAVVSGTIAGSGDKAVFEAMAVGRPTLVSNPAFAQMLVGIEPSLAFPEGDAQGLASRIAAISSTSANVRGEIGETLRARVEREHSLEHWADRVAELAVERGPR